MRNNLEDQQPSAIRCARAGSIGVSCEWLSFCLGIRAAENAGTTFRKVGLNAPANPLWVPPHRQRPSAAAGCLWEPQNVVRAHLGGAGTRPTRQVVKILEIDFMSSFVYGKSIRCPLFSVTISSVKVCSLGTNDPSTNRTTMIIASSMRKSYCSNPLQATSSDWDSHAKCPGKN